jgi:hypothetical protein
MVHDLRFPDNFVQRRMASSAAIRDTNGESAEVHLHTYTYVQECTPYVWRSVRSDRWLDAGISPVLLLSLFKLRGLLRQLALAMYSER